jgi:RNA polymerase sigma-70 factor, ECF subfamily
MYSAEVFMSSRSSDENLSRLFADPAVQPATLRDNAPAADRRELMRLVMGHQGFIKAYALAITRDHHLAEDVFQEVCLLLAEQWERTPAGLPVPWLKEVVRRQSLKAATRARRHVLLSHEALVVIGDAFPAPTEDEDRGLRNAMVDCLGKLTGITRKVVEARYSEGSSCENIAAAVGRSVQSVYAILKRSRIALEDCVRRVDPSLIKELSDG